MLLFGGRPESSASDYKGYLRTHDRAKDALGWAVDAGALKVTNSNLRPTESATRAEAANALLAAMNKQDYISPPVTGMLADGEEI